jgi:hypothetical protein
MDLSKLRFNLFEFGFGGRMLKIFGGLWSDAVTADDKDNVCDSDQVRQCCIEWPRINSNEFETMCRLASKFTNGDMNRARLDMQKHEKKEKSSEHRDASLSGIVDTAGLPPKASRRQRKLALDTKEALTEVQKKLVAAWTGDGIQPPTGSTAQIERDNINIM